MSNPFQIHCGDALEVLKRLDAESVDCCVTSVPYYGLRDYGTAKWHDGDPACDHLMIRGSQGASGQRADRTHTQRVPYRDTCGRCGAIRVDQQIGLEETPQAYIKRLIEVFDEVRRVLKPTGTLWLNAGDSFNAHPNQRSITDKAGVKQITKRGSTGAPSRCVDGLKAKDLIGIPWMLSFALRDSGGWLRQWMPWIKWNGMCESTKDRPTSSCESIFLLSKSATYFYDYEAVKKPVAPDTPSRYGRGRSDEAKYADGGPGGQTIARTFDHMLAKQDGHGRRHAGFNDREFSQEAPETRARRNSDWFKESLQGMLSDEEGEPLAFVVNTLPTKEAHFAAFPITLVEPMILAGCPDGGICLDPFSGLATVGLAALRHGRNYIGIELSQKYVDLSYERARRIYPLLMEGVA